MIKDINHALVEDVRPPIYTAMKYWGKKPHNIWRTYIENYTPKEGIYLDPFSGSAVSAFEAIKAGRKAIAFDLNPLTSFIIEAVTSKFDKKKFEVEVNRIVSLIENDPIYIKFFNVSSRHTNAITPVICYKWNKDQLYELGPFYTDAEHISILKKKKLGKLRKPYRAQPNNDEQKLAQEQKKIKIPYWYPDHPFHVSPSFSASFITEIGGNNFSNLWTRRNLYVLSKIFDEILKQTDTVLQRQLLFGFIQCTHLCSKMAVPRNPGANRDFSTSWGRSAYLAAARKMEMNSLLVFKNSCIGKQSVESALASAQSYLGKSPKILNVSVSNKQKSKLTGFDLKYGIVDINAITDFIPDNSIDFIMTDPPYGGLVQYLDLSSIWLNWLVKIDPKYNPNYSAEITIKNRNFKHYQSLFTNGIKNLYKLLKPSGKVVFTFHNKDLKIWNAFLTSLTSAGFTIEKVIHQQNRRTGESNVANPYGTSASDFYIRCIKSPHVTLKDDKDEFKHFVVTKAIQIIASRNEPTPYQFLFNGLLTEISSAGFDLEDFDSNIEQILNEHIDSTFRLTANETNKAGNNWWFVAPHMHIKYPDRLLTDRVENTILAFLRRKVSVDFDEVLAEIFIKYPNGLTPDIKSIDKILMNYAYKSQGKWIYRQAEIEAVISEHSKALKNLAIIGKKLGYEIFVGKREQPEQILGKKLSEFAHHLNLKHLKFDKQKIARIEMIDMLWIKDDKIELVFEVENSTNFTSGVQRASNLDASVKKVMVIPNNREGELKSLNDPLFTENFLNQNWKYLRYSDLELLLSTKIKDLQKFIDFTIER